MDDLDRRLLNQIQTKFPVTQRPYAALADEFGVDQSEIIRRLGALKQEKILRRLGGVVDTRRIGFQSTLVAMKVPPQRLEEVAGIVSSYPGVTHNYERAGEINLWFTLIARPEQTLEGLLDEIGERTGIGEIHNLPTDRVFKIGVKLDLEGED